MATAAVVRPSLRLDLSSLSHASLRSRRTTASLPTNTLLITNLDNPDIFTAQNLALIQRTISAYAPIHTFSPLRSFSRIIVTFSRVADAQQVRNALDGESICGVWARVGFGRATKIYPRADAERLLKASTRSHGGVYSSKRHAVMAANDEDRANALDGLRSRRTLSLPVRSAESSINDRDVSAETITAVQRCNSASPPATPVVVVYEPHSPDLPAIAVEDTTPQEDLSMAMEM